MAPVVFIGMLVLSAVSAFQSYRTAKKLKKANQGRLVQVRAAAYPRRVPYGRSRIGALEVDVANSSDEGTTNNKYLHYIMVWGDGPIEDIEELWFDDELITVNVDGTVSGRLAGFVWAYHHTGTPTQNVDSAAELLLGYTSTDRFVGVAYTHIRLKYSEDKWKDGTPSNITAVVQGRNDIYDPRTTTSGYTDNCALCMNHFMTLASFGPRLDYDERIREETLIESADICDEAVALSAGGTEARYTFNGFVSADADPSENMEQFLIAMAGWRSYVQGRWDIYAGHYVTPTFTITLDMLVGPATVDHKGARRDRYNTARGVFCGEDEHWQEANYPAFTKAAWVTEDNSRENELEVDFPNTKSVTCARRLAKIFTLSSRYGATAEFTLDVRGMRAKAGGTVYVNIPEFKLVNLPMEVHDWEFSIDQGKIQIKVQLRETNAAIFEWDGDAEEDNDLGGYVSGSSSTSLGDPIEAGSVISVAFYQATAVDEEKFGNYVCPAGLRLLYADVTAGTAPAGASLQLDLIDRDTADAELSQVMTLADGANYQRTTYSSGYETDQGQTIGLKFKQVGSGTAGGTVTATLFFLVL